MKTDCDKLSVLLGAYADGELDAARAAHVEKHLATCAECRHELEVLRRLHHLARRAEPPQMHDDYWDWHRTRVWHRINQDMRVRQRFYRPSFVWPKLATLAGGLVVVLVVAVVGWQTLGPGLSRHAEHASADKLLATSTPPSPAGRADAERQAPRAEKVVSRSDGEPAHTVVAGETESEGGARDDRAEERTVQARTGAAMSKELTTVAAAVEKKTEPRDKDRVSSAGGKPSAPGSDGGVREIADDELRKTPVESLATLLKGGTALRIVSAKPKVADVRPVRQGVQTVPATDDTGTAIVGLTTDTLGVVVDVRIVRSSGKPKLDSIALAMARKSRFSPGRRDGRPAQFSIEVPYRFDKLARKKTTK